MFTDPVITNPFVADGIIPETYGYRTVLEYRARLFCVAPSDSSSSTLHGDDMDIITPTGEPITPAPTNPDAPIVSETGSYHDDNVRSTPLAPDVREGERALRALANSLDLTALGPLHPTFYAIMRVVPPPFVRRSAVSAHRHRQQQYQWHHQQEQTLNDPNNNDSITNTNNNNNDNSADVVSLSATSTTLVATTMLKLMQSFRTARSIFLSLIKNETASSVLRRIMTLGGDGSNLYRDAEPSLLSWHWADDLLAISTGVDLDRICAFHFQSNDWSISGDRHNSLIDIRCLQFRPFAGRVLALGGRHGVHLLDRQDLISLNNNTDSSHIDICSLDWSPDGQWLASASAADGSIRIWDIATLQSRTLPYSGAIVKFNPNRDAMMLFVADAAGTNFRLWDLRTWKTERWGSLSGPVIAATWSFDGSTLLFSTQNANCIHTLSLARPDNQAVSSGKGGIGSFGAGDASITHVEMTVLPREGPGGTPILLELDPTGERLAVVYEVPEEESPDIETSPHVRNDPHRRFAVALFSTQFIPSFIMAPIGYVSGPAGAGPPVAVKFKPQPVGEAGATLACMWRSGQITFTHLFFNAPRKLRS